MSPSNFVSELNKKNQDVLYSVHNVANSNIQLQQMTHFKNKPKHCLVIYVRAVSPPKHQQPLCPLHNPLTQFS